MRRTEVVGEFGAGLSFSNISTAAEPTGASRSIAKRRILGAYTALLDRTCGCVTMLLDEGEALAVSTVGQEEIPTRV